jgi:hypothetical protein
MPFGVMLMYVCVTHESMKYVCHLCNFFKKRLKKILTLFLSFASSILKFK